MIFKFTQIKLVKALKNLLSQLKVEDLKYVRQRPLIVTGVAVEVANMVVKRELDFEFSK